MMVHYIITDSFGSGGTVNGSNSLAYIGTLFWRNFRCYSNGTLAPNGSFP